jgi:hypothetical protein
MRKHDSCMNCGEVREMAARGLCFKCYRAAQRVEKASLWTRQGKGWLLKEQKKAFTVITGILKAIADCPGLEEDDVKQIRNILRPYLDGFADCFAPRECIEAVNSEQELERSPTSGKATSSEASPG